MHRVISNFLEHWPRIKEDLKDKDILLFLDYDGTLTPIVERPEEAVLAPETSAVLDRLTMNGHCRVVIVSGRSLEDLKTRVGLKKITYVGNHGFEISGPSIHFENSYFPQSRRIFDHVIEELRRILTAMPGVLIEDKGITLSIHVRRLDERKKRAFKAALYRTIRPHVRLKDICLREGKEVYELRPPVEWDKGKAVLWLIRECGDQSTFSMYVGDDQTDEDAFKVLKDHSVTIRVGRSPSTAAQYYLESPQDVAALLTEIELLLKNE